MLDESGRLRLRTGLRGVIESERWHIDEPPVQWFEHSAEAR
jgi:hypothetical protein